MDYEDDFDYDLDDPKHPTYAERMYEWYDMERKRAREDACPHVQPLDEDMAHDVASDRLIGG